MARVYTRHLRVKIPKRKAHYPSSTETCTVKRAFVVGIFALCFGERLFAIEAQNSITGHWEGSIAQSTGELRLGIDIKSNREGFAGSFDVPAAAVFKFPL